MTNIIYKKTKYETHYCKFVNTPIDGDVNKGFTIMVSGTSITREDFDSDGGLNTSSYAGLNKIWDLKDCTAEEFNDKYMEALDNIQEGFSYEAPVEEKVEASVKYNGQAFNLQGYFTNGSTPKSSKFRVFFIALKDAPFVDVSDLLAQHVVDDLVERAEFDVWYNKIGNEVDLD